MAYTIPMLLADWDNIGTVEPFPVEAADLLLSYMNHTVSDERTNESVACLLECASTMEPPQRYTRRGFGKKQSLWSPMLETEPMGAAETDPENVYSNMDYPSGPPE